MVIYGEKNTILGFRTCIIIGIKKIILLKNLNVIFIKFCQYCTILAGSINFLPWCWLQLHFHPHLLFFSSIVSSTSPSCPSPTPASPALMSVFVDALGWGAIVQNDHNYDAPPTTLFALILPKNKLCKAEREERGTKTRDFTLASSPHFFFLSGAVDLLSWFLWKYFYFLPYNEAIRAALTVGRVDQGAVKFCKRS